MSTDFATARKNMVDGQVRTQDVTDLNVVDAMRLVAREDFVPPDKTWLAYADTEVEYAPGRWLLRPRDVGKLLQALHPRPGARALAIAAPYAAAVLARIGLAVDRLTEGNLLAVAGAYDLIVCEGAVPAAPAGWLAALAPGGRLGLVERRGRVGRAILYLNSGGAIGARPLFDSSPPIMAGFALAPVFQL